MNTSWQPSSLFLRSELINWRANSVLEDLGDAVVVRTPSNPSRKWGHVLLLKAPPRTEDIPRWRSVFETKIKPHQPVPTWILSWDDPMIDEVARSAYFAEGLRYHSFDVLVLGSLASPASFKTGIEIVDLKFESDLWPEVIESNIACFGTEDETTDHRRIQFAGHRAIVAHGKGHWYAAFFEGQLAGSLGL